MRQSTRKLLSRPAQLPYREDVRSAEFGSFDTLPQPISAAQLDAMDALIAAMDLTAGDHRPCLPHQCHLIQTS